MYFHADNCCPTRSTMSDLDIAIIYPGCMMQWTMPDVGSAPLCYYRALIGPRSITTKDAAPSFMDRVLPHKLSPMLEKTPSIPWLRVTPLLVSISCSCNLSTSLSPRWTGGAKSSACWLVLVSWRKPTLRQECKIPWPNVSGHYCCVLYRILHLF